MSSITEQFSAATKSQLEAQIRLLSSLANTAVDSAEKVIALNINTTKASVEKSSAAAKKLWSAKDPKEFFSAAEPLSMDNLLAYSRALYSIASTAQNELIQSARHSFQPVSELSAAKPAPAAAPAAAAATPPALAAAVSAAVAAVNEPPAVEAPKEAKAKPIAVPTHPAAAPIAEPELPLDVKPGVKPIKAKAASAPKPRK